METDKKVIGMLLGIFLLTAFFFSCKKKESPDPAPNGTTTSKVEAQLTSFTNLTPTNLGVLPYFNRVTFPTALIGYSVGYNGTIMKTTDGGVSWSLLTSGTSNTLTGVTFLDKFNGFVVGGLNTVIKTTDGGATWQPVVISGVPTSNFTDIYFNGRNIGFVTGSNGVLLKTIDGGTTWTYSTLTTSILRSVEFYDLYTGIVVGEQGYIAQTLDGGNTWKKLPNVGGPTASEMIYDVQLVVTPAYDTLLYTIGNFVSGGLYSTTYIRKYHYGTWSLLSNPKPTDYFTGIYMDHFGTGYICGGNIINNTGTVLETLDYGTTWTIRTLPLNTERLGGQFFFNNFSNSNGFFVGNHGTVLKGQ